jgi:hypothetical protein
MKKKRIVYLVKLRPKGRWVRCLQAREKRGSSLEFTLTDGTTGTVPPGRWKTTPSWERYRPFRKKS